MPTTAKTFFTTSDYHEPAIIRSLSVKIGFLAWGSEAQEQQGEAGAYYHRIRLLQQIAQEAGHETNWKYASEFDGPLKLAFTSQKRALGEWLMEQEAVYLGHTDCAAYAASALSDKNHLIYDSHTPLIGERLMILKVEKTPRNLYLYLRSCLHERLAAKRCRVLTTVSDAAIDYYHRVFRRSKSDLFLVRNMVDEGKSAQLSFDFTGPRRFAYIGGMSRWQGVPDLIEAYRRSPKRDFDLTIVGFDESTHDLMEKAKSVGISAYPRMARSEALTYLSSSHFGVTATPKVCAIHMPGAFPTKWAEYLFCNRSVMITRAYDCAKITEQHSFGVVCDPGPDGLVEGFSQAVSLSNEAIVDMANRGREWVIQNCTLNAVGPHFLSAIHAAVT